MNRLILFFCLLFPAIAQAQLSTSFELRYYSKEKEVNGPTDFKGELEYFNTDERILFLEQYANFASKWFLDSALNIKVNDPEEVYTFLEELKSEPLPTTRRRIILDAWKKAGISKEGHKRSLEKIETWKLKEGVEIADGKLRIIQPNSRITLETDTLRWRFFISWKAMNMSGRVPSSISLLDGTRVIAEAGFHSNGNIFFTDNGYDRMAGAYIPGKWYDFKLEVDLVNDRYNLLVNGDRVGDWARLKSHGEVTRLRINANDGISFDEIRGLKFDTTGCTVNHPYTIEAFMNEDFDIVPDLQGWYAPAYNDKAWTTDTLPVVHGGALEAGEDLYMRKKITPGPFKKAILHLESLDPGGEIWINGEVTHVTHSRHPLKLDISAFLIPHKENTIAIRVYSFRNDENLYHSPNDRNIGWFCGRAWLDLGADVLIEECRTYTASLSPDAEQHHYVNIRNHSDETFEGSLLIEYYPWFPAEGAKRAAEFTIPVKIFARDTVVLQHHGMIKDPLLWTHEDPNLYRVHFQLIRDNKTIDDEVLTTGIRTVSQEDGIFRINGKAELLRGAQTMGFRIPIENTAKWNRCAPDHILADELLACKKLGNTLRIHVHAGGKYAYSINDPRIAEMADQLGVMLVWPTSAWIREGEWGGIDFEGYPHYMEQVFNHPSIVMWEGSNHPNRFGDKGVDYTNRFVSKMYKVIAGTDSSRLISPSSYNNHFSYRNDAGSIDRNGQSIVPAKEWTAPLLVRGNQDALTGYGNHWDVIRNWPDPYRKSLIESSKHAYFNFEHEESIGMQDFEHARGMPWYQLPSYENSYDTSSIGRHFDYSEWRISQAWQAFSAWESTKWQRLQDVDGFSWCCLHGGPNSGTYRKPLIDAFGHAKLAYYTNRMALQDIVAGSDNTDVVFGKKDDLTPVILNVGPAQKVNLKVQIRNQKGELIQSKVYEDVIIEEGRTQKKLPPFRLKTSEEGYYFIEYYVLKA